MPESELFMGVDVGTSKLRVAVLDAGGSRVADAALPMPAAQSENGLIVQSAELWLEVLQTVLDQALEGLERHAVRAISVDGTSGTVLLVHPDGRPASKAIMYNDQGCKEESARIAGIAPAGAQVLGTSSTLARALRLRAMHPGQDLRIMHQADWVAGWLRGVYDCGDENNALKLGYLPVERRWPAWMAELGIETRSLCRIVPAGTALGPVSVLVAERFGLPAKLQVIAGTTDSVAAALSTGVSAPGDAVTSLGSTLVLKVASAKPIFDARYGIYTHRIGDIWLAGGASNTGGAVLRYHFSDELLAELSGCIDPDVQGRLDYYPLLSPGERFPVNDPAFAAKLSPRPANDAEFLAEMLFAMARIERDGYRLLAELGAPYPARVMTAGGGAANAVWTAMREKMLGVPVIASDAAEASVGVALLARTGATQ